jgi:hypothetical protein
VYGRSTVPVYKYTYMDPDFVIGSCQGGLLQPIQQQTWSLIWRDPHPLNQPNTLFGLQPYSSSYEGTMYFGAAAANVTDLITRSKADYDSPDKLAGGSPYEQVCQQGPALIALYDIPPQTRFPQITTFFSRDLKRQADPSGWIFGQAGPAYVAYYPLARGEWKPMGWTGLLKGGAGGWFATGYSDMAKDNQCLVSTDLKNGYLVQVAPQRDYPSLAAFADAVRRLPRETAQSPKPRVKYTALDGTRFEVTYGQPPRINGQAPDYRAWPLFDSPYGHSKRGSHRLDLEFQGQHYTLDFASALTASTP